MASCSAAYECSSNIKIGGLCGCSSQAEQGTHCPTGYWCEFDKKLCRKNETKKEIGESCGSNPECFSGRCDDGIEILLVFSKKRIYNFNFF
jgi:hypothetical protein